MDPKFMVYQNLVPKFNSLLLLKAWPENIGLFFF